MQFIEREVGDGGTPHNQYLVKREIGTRSIWQISTPDCVRFDLDGGSSRMNDHETTSERGLSMTFDKQRSGEHVAERPSPFRDAASALEEAIPPTHEAGHPR